MVRPILLLPGMTPDARIYNRLLPLLPNAQVVEWIQPIEVESIQQYAQRLANSLNSPPGAIVCGVSFGGIIAPDFSRSLAASACVLISTVRNTSELPPWFRVFRRFAIISPRIAMLQMKLVGRLAARYPCLLRRSSTWRLAKFNGAHGQWYSWASAAVLNWDSTNVGQEMLVGRLHGALDSTFPIRYTQGALDVVQGGHELPLSHPDQVAQLILQVQDKLDASTLRRPTKRD